MPENKFNQEQKREIENMIQGVVKSYDRVSSFKQRKVIDTPTDAYSIVNRRFATLNGTVANRPKSSVATVGQSYFATDTAIPMVYSVGGWRNGVGSVVAQNN